MNQLAAICFRAVMAGVFLFTLAASAVTNDFRGAQFIGFKTFSSFKKSAGEQTNEVVLTSPEIRAGIPWDEIILSWNADAPAGTYLKLEARAVYTNHSTRFYTMGLWSADPSRHPRESVLKQKDDDGDVQTDTLVLKQPAGRLLLRITLGGDGKLKPKLKFLSASLLDSSALREPLPPNRAAWGKTIEVPERSQMAYEGGGVWCSPTTVSMLLAFWSERLKRGELDRDVPEVAKGVFDANWHGTGNWVFNTAYAGSFRGLRAYATRLSDVAELEDFVARGIPVGLSLCYDRLRGVGRGPNGHLVVCVGFTENGDPVINDPGTSIHVRKTFSRERLMDAWAYSKNTVYLIYPENARLPKDRFAHWESSASRKAATRK
ncbi:MAG: peptidase C39 family protein [Verrucomicrobia bacterium]|nr:MAG: peptidase C39 family protein [Verrucomicrobiota bacterium]